MDEAKENSASSGSRVLGCFVVAAVTLILLAFFFPFTSQDYEPRVPRKADTDMRVIVSAVQQYYADYRHYPMINPERSAGAPSDSSCGDPAAGMETHNAALFNILRALDQPPNTGHALNPRRTVYIETHAVSKNNSPKDGFLDVAVAGHPVGCWYDPWGCEYNIVIDTNGDGALDLKKFYKDFAGEMAPRETVGAFSLGKDKTLGKNGDHTYKKDADYSDDRVSWTSH